VLVNVVGGADMTISEAEKVAEIIRAKVSSNARIIWGAAVDPTLDHKIRVMVVITGVTSKQIRRPEGRTQQAHRNRRRHNPVNKSA